MNIHIGEKWGNRYDKTVKLTIDYIRRLVIMPCME